MNLPNKITLLRVCLIPIFLIIYLAQPFHEAVNMWLAFVIFVSAAITDAIDGYLARKYKLVTNFGKLMDPLADKLLVCSAFIAFTYVGLLPAWAVIILISREFYISGLRQIALESRIVLAATVLNKFKTTAQLTLIIYMLLPLTLLVFDIVVFILLIITVVISVVSVVDFTLKNIQIFNNQT